MVRDVCKAIEENVVVADDENLKAQTNLPKFPRSMYVESGLKFFPISTMSFILAVMITALSDVADR